MCSGFESISFDYKNLVCVLPSYMYYLVYVQIPIYTNPCTHKSLHAHIPIDTNPCMHQSLYTGIPLLYTPIPVHTNPCIHKFLYAQIPVYTNSCVHEFPYAPIPVYTNPYVQEFLYTPLQFLQFINKFQTHIPALAPLLALHSQPNNGGGARLGN
jgi:hypothetical protein